MKSSQRQTIQEVIDACRVHEKATEKVEGLEDVNEGLAISATKLEAALAEDHDHDPKRNAKVAKLLKEKLVKAEGEVRLAKHDVQMFAANPRGKLKWGYAEALVQATATRDALSGAVAEVMQAAKENRPACAALREWARSSLESIRVTRTGGRSIMQVFEEVEEDNGLKQAVRVVLEIIDFEVNVK